MKPSVHRSVRGLVLLLLSAAMLSGCAVPLEVQQGAPPQARSAADEPPALDRLTGVNWFGFESSAYIAHGLWVRDYKSMLRQMKDLGFNAIRIPFSNEMLTKYPFGGLQSSPTAVDPYTHAAGMNVDLAGLSSLQILDKIIDHAAVLGLRIILDNHSRKADGYYNQTLWYTADFTEAQWIADWRMVATRYQNRSNVVAYDLNNEPHGGYLIPGMSPAATWGFDLPGVGGPTDWKAAAERAAAAIMEIDTDVIIIVQGVQDYQGTNAWWGSNLRGVRTQPITSIPKNRLMYSVHEYGPEVHSQDWFEVPEFPDNLPALWNDAFWFIYDQNLAGLYVGEMGIKEETAANPASVPYRWFTKWLQFAGDRAHFTYWSWNPNSGDTGGILQDDWLTVNPAKYALLQPYLEPLSSTDPDPNPTPAPSLSLQYLTTQPQTSTNSISLRVKVTNSGGSTALSAVKVRYYFTGDNGLSDVFHPDYSGGVINGSYQTLTGVVSGTFGTLNPSVSDADRYLEIGFQPDSGNLATGGSFEVQLRITNPAWLNYNQSNDYSFLPAASSFSPNPHMVLLHGTSVVSGTAP